MSIKLIKVKDYNELSEITASIINDLISNNRKTVLGLATGGSPEGLYKLLITKYKKTSWIDVKTFNLDEYIGLSEDSDMTYKSYMHKKLFDYINISSQNIHLPNPHGNLDENAAQYDKLIYDAGGIDLQLLGVGENGHIGFNEPGTDPKKRTHVVDLSPTTIRSNSRYFKSITDVPSQAITMGIANILEAKRIILIASGVKKARAISQLIDGSTSEGSPITYLKNHNHVTVIIDEEAASMLKK